MQAMQRAMEAPAKLKIAEANGSITFTDNEGRAQTFATNNKKEQHPVENGTADVKTKWKDGRLVKETSFDNGLKLTETYSLIPNADQLQVLTKLSVSRMSREVTLKRIYDRERRVGEWSASQLRAASGVAGAPQERSRWAYTENRSGDAGT